MIRGSCPTVHAPMATGDGLLVRVKPPASCFRPSQLRTLAAAAARYGNGTIELTSRAHLQVRGLRPETTAPFAAAMIEAALAHPDAAFEQRRCVMLAPGGDRALALALEAELATMAGLPSKFGVAVEHAALPLGPVPEDILLTISGQHSILRVGGAAAAVPTPAAIEWSLRIAQAVAASGARRSWGVKGLLESVGLRPTPMAPMPRAAMPRAGLPFGSAPSSLWTRLASWGEVHLLPFRAMVIDHAPRAALTALGMMVDDDDPLWRVAACPGAPSCGQATVDTRHLAARLATSGKRGATIHVSGCPKGCALPDAADWTLVGRAGAYDVVRAGRAGDAPSWTGLSAMQILETLT